MHILDRAFALGGKVVSFIRTHRRISAGVLVVAIVGWILLPGGNAQSRYMLAQASRSTLIVSVSGSGQVEASQQIDMKPKGSGDVVGIYASAGQTVARGQLIAQLDATDELQALADAKATLEKLQRNQPKSASDAQENLENAYEDAFSSMADAYLDLPNLLNTAWEVLYDDTLGGNCSLNSCELANMTDYAKRDVVNDLLAIAERDYAATKEAYDPAFSDYRNLRYDAQPDEFFALLDASEHVAGLLTQALKSELNVLDAVKNDLKARDEKIPAQLSQYQSAVGAAIGSSNAINSKLASMRRSIESAQNSLDDIAVDQPLDLAAQQRTVQQRQEALADRSIRAPFAGKLVSLDVQQGDTVSSGTTVGTLVTDTLVVTVSLNEVDSASVAVGQPVSVTFDAIPDLILAGTVAEIDTLGTTSQGVVTYDAKISLDTQDARIKPGMTVTVSIITSAQIDALVVPSSAIQVRNNQSYVKVYRAGAPAEAFAAQGFIPSSDFEEVPVTTGLSNDTETEIVSGLAENDAIVVRTVGGNTSTSATGSSPLTNNREGGNFRSIGF